MDTSSFGNGDIGLNTPASDSREQSLWTRDELIVSLHSLLRIRNKEVDREEEINRLADLLRRSRGGVEGKFGDLAEIRGNQQGRTSLDKAVWREFPTLTDQLRQEALKAETRIRSGIHLGFAPHL